jgi:hypothetical protein
VSASAPVVCEFCGARVQESVRPSPPSAPPAPVQPMPAAPIPAAPRLPTADEHRSPRRLADLVREPDEDPSRK